MAGLLANPSCHWRGEENAPASQQGSKRDRKAKSKNPELPTTWYHWASRLLTGASVALPGGFFLGGMVIRGGDPGHVSPGIAPTLLVARLCLVTH